jgi:hypothetical protein
MQHKIHFNITVPSTPKSPKWSLPFPTYLPKPPDNLSTVIKFANGMNTAAAAAALYGKGCTS